MFHDADECEHPRVQVTLETDEHFRLFEGQRGDNALLRLANVSLTIDLRHDVNVVQHHVRVAHREYFSGLHSHHGPFT
ncbi:MAG TPA: hypothetical protein VK530_15465 [Candidatus Acidoferrum sp.]|nr:hypothetical protein [Candidatus Acidoferrum sp.]